MGKDSKVSTVHLNFFKSLFLSVSYIPENETILQPYLEKIINNCLKFAAEMKESENYFILLKTLFRSIGGKSEQLYKEFLPQLSSILKGLNKLQNSSFKKEMRDLFAELCLTVPVRLSALLPHLSLLMNPLVVALNSKNNELVLHGLRTLELCVDNLSPNYLEPFLSRVNNELLFALWKHLHIYNSHDSLDSNTSLSQFLSNQMNNPNNSNLHSVPPNLKSNQYQVPVTAMITSRIIGKLAGKNKDFLRLLNKHTQEEQYKRLFPTSLVLFFDKKNNLSTKLEIEPIVQICSDHLLSSESTKDINYTFHCFSIIKSILLSLFPSHQSEQNTEQLFECQKDFLSQNLSNQQEKQENIQNFHFQIINEKSNLCKTRIENEGEGTLFKEMIKCVLNSSVILENSTHHKSCLSFLEDLLNYFSFLYYQNPSKCQNNVNQLSHQLFFEAIIELIGNENLKISKFAIETVERIFQRLKELYNDDALQTCNHYIISDLCEYVCGLCYQREWNLKSGGCFAISSFLKIMPVEWLKKTQIEIVSALLFILKYMPPEVSVSTLEEATLNLTNFIKTCYSQSSSNQNPNIDEKFMILLVSELSNSNVNVRKNVKNLLELLKSCLGEKITISQMLKPHKKKYILEPILNCFKSPSKSSFNQIG